MYGILIRRAQILAVRSLAELGLAVVWLALRTLTLSVFKLVGFYSLEFCGFLQTIFVIVWTSSTSRRVQKLARLKPCSLPGIQILGSGSTGRSDSKGC